MELEKLKTVICLIYKFAHGNITSYQLAKALYLTDYLSIILSGRPVLGLEFVYHHYGPYPKQAIKALEEEDFLKTERRLSKSGYLTYLKHPRNYEDKDIEDHERKLIFVATKTVKEKSARGVKELNAFIYSTEPMKATKKGQVVRMDRTLAKRRLNQVKRRLDDKGLSYYTLYPEGLDELERTFLEQTDIQFAENRPE